LKKFEFKLHRLLEIREAREREIENELAGLLSVQNIEKTRQEKLKTGIVEEEMRFQKKLKKGEYTTKQLIMFEKYIDVSHRAIDSTQVRIDKMEPGIHDIRKKLIQASKDKKVVEKLKEKKFKEYEYEMNREIAKENDDTNQKIYYRRIHN